MTKSVCRHSRGFWEPNDWRDASSGVS